MGAFSRIKNFFTQCWKPRVRGNDETVRHPETKKCNTDFLEGLSEVAAPAPVENSNEERVYPHSTLEDNWARLQTPN